MNTIILIVGITTGERTKNCERGKFSKGKISAALNESHVAYKNSESAFPSTVHGTRRSVNL